MLSADGRCIHHLWNGDELESLGLGLWNEKVCRDHCLRTIRTHAGVTAIMQENHVATAKLAAYPLFDLVRGVALPILATHVPHHGHQSKRSDNLQSSWPAATEGRAKQRGVLADSLRHGLLAFLELGSGLLCRSKNQIGVGRCVVTDDVACVRDFANNIRTLFDVASNQEERGFDVVFC